MEILHLKDLGDTESVVTNAVVLVLGVSCHFKIIADGQTARQTHTQPQ